MRHLAVVLLFAAVPAVADEKAKPNTLTPKEIADGWILLFDGETTFGWKTEGDVTVKEGALVLKGGAKEAVISCPARFSDYELKLELLKGSGNGSLGFKTKNSMSAIGLPAQPTRIDLHNKTTKAGTTTESNLVVGPNGSAIYSGSSRIRVGNF